MSTRTHEVKKNSSITDILYNRARLDAERLGYIFISQDGSELCMFDYAQIDRRVRAIAARLQRESIVGERVLLVLPAGPDYIAGFFACIYAGTIPVPIYPPANERGHARLGVIARDSGATVGLTTSAVFSKTRAFPMSIGDPGAMRWLTMDAIDESDADDWRETDADPSALAFIQYTSGSTGDPKGVMVSHRSLLLHLEAVAQKFGPWDGAIGMGWLPPFHDMGLVAFVLQPTN